MCVCVCVCVCVRAFHSESWKRERGGRERQRRGKEVLGEGGREGIKRDVGNRESWTQKIHILYIYMKLQFSQVTVI